MADQKEKIPDSAPLGEEKLTEDGGVSKTVLSSAAEGAPRPEDGAEVSVHYTGYLMDETKFDSSVDRIEPFKFVLGESSVIKGWDIGLKTMAVGEKINLFCMPEYAYGEKGSGKIPPNATLRFEIELLAVAFPSITDDKAVRKESLLPGEGYRTPKEGARCVLSIAGKALKKDRSEVPFLPLERREVLDIDESELRPAGLFECAKSLKKGEKARFFIAPGKMHFAADELPPGVAPEDELVYEIEMVEFENEKDFYDLSPQERIAAALAAKDEGNVLYKKHQLRKAIRKYSRAATLLESLPGLSTKPSPSGPGGMMGGLGGMMGGEDDEDVKLSAEEEKSRDAARPALVAVLSNLSLVYAKSGDHGAALEKAAGALALDEGCAKARYRRAEAFAATGRYEEALEDMRKVAESQPDAPLYQKKCEEIKRRKVAADKKVDMFYRQMFDGVKRV